jgi:uncharacterized membrane protein YjjB (DUF3815 family)
VRLNIAIPEAHVSAPVLNGALEAVTRLNESLIKAGASPTSYQLLEQGAKWQPEPPGDEHFDHGAEIERRGWGDCDDWGPLHAATLRVTGEDPGARSVVRKSGPKRWHATTIRSDGTEDDPSLMAGMPGPARVIGIRGATLPIMYPRVHGVGGTYIATPHLALRPVADRFGQLESWQARADLPWHWGPGNSPAEAAMVSLHQSPVSSQAVVGAVLGARRIGICSGADPEALKRLSALADACEGASWEELAEMYGREHATAAGAVVGSFFGKALRKMGKLAKGAVRLAAPALSLIPGGSIATAAFNMASPALKKGVLKQGHVAPQQRKPVELSPQRAAPRAPGPPTPAAGSNWLPYPYPLPYPVPGWGAAAESPGAAWPPRGL